MTHTARSTIGRLTTHTGYTQAADVEFTGAGFFLIGEHGWLAGIGPTRYWQDFGGKRKPGETALQTAAREMKAETGITADTLTTLHTHVTFKNEHVYVIHVARAPDGVAPRPSRELTQFKWMRDFANDFSTETKEAIHRRVLDDEFLTAVNAIHGNIARGAAAARRAVRAHATPTPTATPHQLPCPSQPEAGRVHQHANAPEQTHANRSIPTARHSVSDDAITEYLDYVATTTKRAPYAPEESANDAGSDASANPRKKTPRILHPSQQPPAGPTTTRLQQPQQQQHAQQQHQQQQQQQQPEHHARGEQRQMPTISHRTSQDEILRRIRQPQPRQQQHQPHQRDIQRQHEQMARINTEEAIRRSLADEHGDEDAAIARSIADEADRQQEAARQNARTPSRSTPPAPPAATQVRKDSGGSRGEGSATSLDPKKLPRASGNHNQSAPRDCDRTRHPLSDTHRVMRNASQRGERESRTRLDGPLKAPCGDGTPEGGTQIKDHES